MSNLLNELYHNSNFFLYIKFQHFKYHTIFIDCDGSVIVVINIYANQTEREWLP